MFDLMKRNDSFGKEYYFRCNAIFHIVAFQLLRARSRNAMCKAVTYAEHCKELLELPRSSAAARKTHDTSWSFHKRKVILKKITS